MPSRMSKYRSEETETRSTRNTSLYNSLYTNNTDYNITSVKDIEKTNEIDIDQVKQLIKDRENYKKQKEYYSLLKKEENSTPSEEIVKEERSYDLNDILAKAKEERKVDEKDTLIKDKHYDYLLTSQIYNKKREQELDEKEEKLKEILNTITKNIDLNNLSNSELSLDLLEDLKGNTKEIEDTSVKKIMAEEQARKEKALKENAKMDETFYTSVLNFSDKDFDDGTPKKKKGRLDTILKVLLIIVLITILAITAYFVYINF